MSVMWLSEKIGHLLASMSESGFLCSHVTKQDYPAGLVEQFILFLRGAAVLVG